MLILTIDPSGTGTTGIFLLEIDNKNIKSYQFTQFKSGEWKEHLNFLVNLVHEEEPEIIIYEDTTYIYGRQHQGTVGLYKLIGGIVGLEHVFSFVKKMESITVNSVKSFKNKLFQRKEVIEDLTCFEGRGKGWKYKGQKISLHQLDALIIYHLWSGKSLESKTSIQQKIERLKIKKRLGTKQKVELDRLESFLQTKQQNVINP